MKFEDINGNGVKDPEDMPLADWTIYLDTNDNNVLDGEEVSTLTGEDAHIPLRDYPLEHIT